MHVCVTDTEQNIQRNSNRLPKTKNTQLNDDIRRTHKTIMNVPIEKHYSEHFDVMCQCQCHMSLQ